MISREMKKACGMDPQPFFRILTEYLYLFSKIYDTINVLVGKMRTNIVRLPAPWV